MAGPEQLERDLAAVGVDPARLRDVLDFGCGCGRLLAGWVMRGLTFRLQGCDYNLQFVAWCNANIPGVLVRQNRLAEPIPYDAGSFDLVYLLSVFTHLTLTEQHRLIAEFHRVLRPKGHLYITFHGEHFYPTMFSQVRDGEATFNREGFLIGNAEREGTNDCWTLHRVDHLVGLCEGFKLQKHFRSIDRGPTDVAAWQDSVILQKT